MLALLVLAVPVALALPGAELWAKRYNGPGNSSDFANALAVDPGGSKVFVTGTSRGVGSNSDYATVAYDASTGAKVWLKRYNGPANGPDEGHAVGVSPDGSKVFVTGTSRGAGSFFDYATVAYNTSTGAKLWVKRYTGPGHGIDSPNALEVSPSGSRVFVAGSSDGSGTGGGDYATLAYNASTGARLWVRRYNGPANGFDEVRALQVSPSGSRLFVTGDSGGSTSIDDFATVAYSASTGTQLWVKRYNGPGNGDDNAHDVGVSPDGSKVYVTGPSEGSTTYDFATIAYNASSGAQLWLRRYSGPARGNDGSSALGVSPDGSRVFVTGGSEGSTARIGDYATVAYGAAHGAKLWAKRYDGGDDDGAAALGVTPDGAQVLVTGSSVGNDYDYATVAYAAGNGGEQWVKRYDGPAGGQDLVNALGVSPDSSKVFVTGESQGTTSADDYATVAYSTR
jgi:hypothetical protein